MPLPHPTQVPRCTPIPTRRPGRLIALLLTALVCGGLAAGCTTDVFSTTTARPVAPPAESCVARCNLQKSQCQARQETREKSCQENFARGKADYELCRTAAIRRCLPPVTCLGTDMTICDRQFEPCIADCGGPRDRNPSGADAARGAEPEAVADTTVVSAGSETPPAGALDRTKAPKSPGPSTAPGSATPAPTAAPASQPGSSAPK